MHRKLDQGIVTTFAFLLFFAQAAEAQERNWLSSPTEAALVAARSGKVIVVCEGADWCHYCKKMDRETWTDRKVQQAVQQNYVLLKLTDVQHNEHLAAMQVKAFPTTLFFTSDRKFLKKIEGFVDAENMVLLLEQIRTADNSSSFMSRK